MLYASEAIETIFEVREKISKIMLIVWSKRIDPSDKGLSYKISPSRPKNKPHIKSNPFHRHDGQIRWLYLDALPELEADGSTLWHCFVSDVTDRKKWKITVLQRSPSESQEGYFSSPTINGVCSKLIKPAELVVFFEDLI